MPLRGKRCERTYGNSSACYRREHVSIGNILEGLPLRRTKTKVNVDIPVALPEGCDRLAIKTPGEFVGNSRIGKSKPVGDLLAQVDPGQHLVFVPVRMDVDRARRVIQDVLHLLPYRADRAQVVAYDAHLDGSLHDIALLQFLDEHFGLRRNER